MTSPRRMDSIVRWGIIALGIYLIAATAAMFWHIARMREAQGWVEHTQ